LPVQDPIGGDGWKECRKDEQEGNGMPTCYFFNDVALTTVPAGNPGWHG
jgi:hypothetical protein